MLMHTGRQCRWTFRTCWRPRLNVSAQFALVGVKGQFWFHNRTCCDRLLMSVHTWNFLKRRAQCRWRYRICGWQGFKHITTWRADQLAKDLAAPHPSPLHPPIPTPTLCSTLFYQMPFIITDWVILHFMNWYTLFVYRFPKVNSHNW